MHRLNKRETNKAELWSDTKTMKELGAIAMESGKDGEIATWAVWLKSEAVRRAQGIQTPGYSGRNSKRRR